MAPLDYRGSQPASRVKVLGDGTLEDDVAGQSDGQTAGTITVGWGGMVRRARARSRTARHLDSAHALVLAVQAGERPAQESAVA